MQNMIKTAICRKELLKRYAFLFLGLFVNALGVSFITKAGLGTSPITSIPYTLSLGFTPTVGMFTFLFNILLLLIQLVLLRKRFNPADFLQIPVIVIFSLFIDLTMSILSFMQPSAYIFKIIALIIGCFILGFGVFMEMVANVVMLPGEATVRAISSVSHTDFGKNKIIFDTTMTIVAAVMAIIMFHSIQGVREGTIIAAVLVGATAKFCKKKLQLNGMYIKIIPA